MCHFVFSGFFGFQWLKALFSRVLQAFLGWDWFDVWFWGRYFPPPSGADRSPEALLEAIKSFYTYGPFVPKVSIEGDWIKIEIDTTKIQSQEKDYHKVIQLCEQGDFSTAEPILKRLIADNPTVSEYYRIMGQIHSDKGDQDEAIN